MDFICPHWLVLWTISVITGLTCEHDLSLLACPLDISCHQKPVLCTVTVIPGMCLNISRHHLPVFQTLVVIIDLLVEISYHHWQFLLTRADITGRSCENQLSSLWPVLWTQLSSLVSLWKLAVITGLSFGTNSGKAAGVVLINLPQGGPEGNQTFPRGAAPRESLIS